MALSPKGEFTNLGQDLGREDGRMPLAVLVVDEDGNPVAVGGGGNASDRELATVTYRVKTAFTGASVGDTITSIRVIDVSGDTPAQLGATIWYNETTAAAVATPSAANLEPIASGGITNAQMSALLAGAATAALQTSTTGVKTTASAALPAGGSGIIGWLSELVTRVIAMAAQLPATLGIKTAALSLSVAPASDANQARETYATVTIVTQSTHATVGATPVAFGSQACSSLDLVNTSLVDIEYQRAAAGNYMRVPAGTSRLVQGITNASQIGVRRVDQVATPVAVQAEAYAV